jgi:hypothetical protein
MAGILVLGTSGGSLILPSPTILQASSNGSGHRATNSETKVHFFRLHHFLLCKLHERKSEKS